MADAFYVRPALAEMPRQTPTMLRETFAPILYAALRRPDEAIASTTPPRTDCPRIFTRTSRTPRLFSRRKRLWITNVNIGTSGAEWRAFGGEKQTGGGRIRLGRVEGLYAARPARSTWQGSAARAGNQVRPLAPRMGSHIPLNRRSREAGTRSLAQRHWGTRESAYLPDDGNLNLAAAARNP
jgi:hypothetical protein